MGSVQYSYIVLHKASRGTAAQIYIFFYLGVGHLQ